MKKILVLISLTFVVISSYGASWTKVYDGKEDILYLDKNSIVKNSDKTYTYWILRSSKVDNSDRPSQKSKETVDCNKRKVKLDYLISYSEKMGNGIITNEDSFDKGYFDIIPDTRGESVFESVCSWYKRL
jgi:hypothetical protein